MKASQSIVFNRQEMILKKLNIEKTIYVKPLAEEFAVSEMTIRRDLLLFEKKGLIERFYGGARLSQERVNNLRTDQEIDDLLEYDVPIKKKIALTASQLLTREMTVYVNSGTTTYYLIKELRKKKLEIITNNLNAFMTLDQGQAKLTLSGGHTDGNKKTLIGENATHTFSRGSSDICFLGISGIDEIEVSSFSLSESLLNRTILEHTNGPRVAIAEGFKIGKRDNFMIAKIALFTHLITDASANKKMLAKLEAKGIVVIVVDQLGR